jgi:hypothetical protein
LEYFKGIVQVSQELKLIHKLGCSNSFLGQIDGNVHLKSVIKHILQILGEM